MIKTIKPVKAISEFHPINILNAIGYTNGKFLYSGQPSEYSIKRYLGTLPLPKLEAILAELKR